MVNEVTEGNQNMAETFDGEAMETERIGQEAINVKKELFANQLENEIIEKKSEMNVEKTDERQMKVGDIAENKFPEILNEGDKNGNKSLENALEIFEFDIQYRQKLQRNALYEEQRSTIKGQVTWRTLHVLFIDTLSSKTKPDFVDFVLSEFDEKVQIKHQWRRHQRYPSLWEGAVAVFNNTQNAQKARIRLRSSKFLTVVPMPEILDALIEAEIRYPDFSETTTVLVIRAKEPLPQKMEQRIAAQLRRFGQVTELKFQPDIYPGEICRACYRYASHAIFAKLICEHSNIPDVGRVSVEVILTRKEARIIGYMRNYIQQK